MATLKITMAVALASLMLAGPAFAQATTGTETKGEKAKGAAEGTKAETPQATGTTDAKSDTMKGDKSAAKPDRKGGGMAMGGEQVKAAQQALKDKGHDPGEVDGKLGPKTQAALRDFQKAQGMTATGRLDAKTMQALGIEAKTSAAPSTGGAASPPTGAGDPSKGAAKDATGSTPPAGAEKNTEEKK